MQALRRAGGELVVIVEKKSAGSDSYVDRKEQHHADREADGGIVLSKHLLK